MVRLPRSDLALELHVIRASTLTGSPEAQNTFLDFPKPPMACFYILVMCKVSASWEFWFSLILGRIFWAGTFGLCCMPCEVS